MPCSPSTDSVIYVGTFYYSFPIIDLTQSDSNLPNLDDKNILLENNLQQGDSPAIGTRLSVITIRPPSVQSLASSASENTIYDIHKTDVAEPFAINDLSRSELKLHHSYPLNQELDITNNCVNEIFNKFNNRSVASSQAELVVQEIIDNLPDMVIASTEATKTDSNQEIVEGPQITIMDVDNMEIYLENMDVQYM